MMLDLFIDPGALRHELSLQQLQPLYDNTGGHDENWVETSRVFARIEPLGGSSRFAAGRWQEDATHRITLRFRPHLSSGMRFEKSGRHFLILTVTDPDDSERYLVCFTREQK